MQTNITQVNPVEYDLEIRATADELAPDLQKVLRAQRSRTQLKGFRKGHVPISVVKKLYGKALAYGVAERSIQETYESSVLEGDEHEVLGRPKITTLEYEMDGDLFAVIRFGVRPSFELASTEGETVSRLVHEVSDEDVEEELNRIREQRVETPAKEGKVEANDVVVVDLQLLDEEGLAVVGSREDEVTYHLGDERVKEPFKQALIGREAGDQVVVVMPHEHDHDHDHDHSHDHDHADRRYQVTLREVRAWLLPELNDELAVAVSDGRFETIDDFRAEIRKQLADAWETRSRELFESSIVEKMIELNPVDVPEAVIDLYLDSFVEDVKRRSEGELPQGFDETAFRDSYREEAERQGRWMLIRDFVIKENELAVGDDDRQAFFDKMSGDGNVDSSFLQQYYSSVPGLMDRMNQRLLSEKVFSFLADHFEVVEKDRETLEAERKEKLEAERKAQEDALGDAEDGESSSWWRRPLDRVRNQLRKPR